LKELVLYYSSLPGAAGNALLFAVAKTIEIQPTDSLGLHKKGGSTTVRKKLYIFLVLWLIVSSQVSCVQPKRTAYIPRSYTLQSSLTELNDISKEIQEIAKGVENWRDIATILLTNELIIEITNLLLINKLSTPSSSLIKDEYVEAYSKRVKTKLEFIRETIQKNHKGINILSNTYSIKSNKAVVHELDKANGIIRALIALLDKEIRNLGK